MEMIKQLQINNYKSIKQLNLSCSRINVFIGKPNVGKSNILEALDLSYLSWFMLMNKDREGEGREKINIKEYFRVNNPAQLFYLGDLSQPISVKFFGFCPDDFITFNKENQMNLFEWGTVNGKTQFDENFIPTAKTNERPSYFGSPIHPYRFKDNIQFHDSGNYFDTLMPPFGNNLANVIQSNPHFRNFIDDLTKDTGFEFNVDTVTNLVSVQLRIKKGLVYNVPYQALADTIRRVIFSIAAIRTNNAHVITLEEPESHSFPPYISMLADEIVEKIDRQFFIATHSPYLLNNLIENTPAEDLSVFVCGYDKENFQTTAKKLSREDLSELLDYGVDIFFNINRYLDDRIEHNS